MGGARKQVQRVFKVWDATLFPREVRRRGGRQLEQSSEDEEVDNDVLEMEDMFERLRVAEVSENDDSEMEENDSPVKPRNFQRTVHFEDQTLEIGDETFGGDGSIAYFEADEEAEQLLAHLDGESEGEYEGDDQGREAPDEDDGEHEYEYEDEGEGEREDWGSDGIEEVERVSQSKVDRQIQGMCHIVVPLLLFTSLSPAAGPF